MSPCQGQAWADHGVLIARGKWPDADRARLLQKVGRAPQKIDDQSSGAQSGQMCFYRPLNETNEWGPWPRKGAGGRGWRSSCQELAQRSSGSAESALVESWAYTWGWSPAWQPPALWEGRLRGQTQSRAGGLDWNSPGPWASLVAVAQKQRPQHPGKGKSGAPSKREVEGYMSLCSLGCCGTVR